MKKMILAVCAMAICTLSARADDTKRKEYAAQAKEECTAGMVEAGLDKDVAEKFCSCYVENALKVLTDKELETLESLGEEEQPEKELAEKLEQIGAPCMESLSAATTEE